MLIRHHAGRKDKHVGACRQKRQTRCRATNYGCWGAIVCNEWRMLIRHHAVRKDKHVGMQRITDTDATSGRQWRRTCWRATNYGCWGAIVPSEKTNTLARAVRKDRPVAVQRITDAEAPSCKQKRQTRWRVPSEKTDTVACNQIRMLMRHRAVRKDKHVGVCNELPMLICHHAVRKDKNTLACNELRMLLRHRTVRKDKHEKAGPKATYQGWRTKSGHSNNVPLLFDASLFLVSADSSKRRDVLPRKMLPRAFSTVHRHNRASDATATAK